MKHLLSICLLAALLAACGQPAAPDGSVASGDVRATPSPAPPGQEAPTADPPPPVADAQPDVLLADRPRIKPAARPAQAKALVRGLNGFAFDLYREVTEGSDDNLITSPHSIGAAFSMVYAGARGETERQMADVLGYLPQQRHHPAANALDRRLASLGADAPPPGEERGQAFQLQNANAVWGQKGFPFEPAFLETLAEQYGAGVRTVDFAADPEGGRRKVNGWVEDRTKGRIKDIVPKGVINPDTRLVLANAIYFKASWLYPFEQSGTEDGPFTLLDGSRVTVPMMRQVVEPLPYARSKDYGAVVLPYEGETTEMVLIQPKAGRFEAVEADLSADYIERVRVAARQGSATLTMPRFEFESELDLADVLPDMGMPDPFLEHQADFSGIARGKDLFISAAIHRATVAVDEEGTEATAATVVVVQEASAMVETPPHLTVDRPFIFAIVERETGAILFLGRVMNPAG